MTKRRIGSLSRPAMRGALVGTASALIAFGGVYAALAATQAGVTEAQSPVKPALSTQPGVSVAQVASTPDSRAVPVSGKSAVVTQVKSGNQAGLKEATKPKAPEVKLERDEPQKRELSSEESAPVQPAPAEVRQAPTPAPVRQAPSYPVQQAPAPVRQAPVQQAPAPAPVRQAPVQQAPAPAPVQQAPAPAPGLTIDLGGRAPVVPQAPIAPKQLHIG